MSVIDSRFKSCQLGAKPKWTLSHRPAEHRGAPRLGPQCRADPFGGPLEVH
jgi:hypothetical protein